MKYHVMVVAAALALSGAAQAQGTVRGAAEGAAAGTAAGGPVGGVVGGVVGAAAGTVGGILGVDERPRFRSYVESEHIPSYRYREEVRVGAVLPEEGVRYYDVPPEYKVHGYRYTVVNDEPVLVDPQTRRVVEVVGPGKAAATTTTVEHKTVLAPEARRKFRTFVQSEHVASFRDPDEVRVGAVLPEAGVRYYDVPAEYELPGYRYTVVNDEPVLVDPQTRRIVEVVE